MIAPSLSSPWFTSTIATFKCTAVIRVIVWPNMHPALIVLRMRVRSSWTSRVLVELRDAAPLNFNIEVIPGSARLNNGRDDSGGSFSLYHHSILCKRE